MSGVRCAALAGVLAIATLAACSGSDDVGAPIASVPDAATPMDDAEGIEQAPAVDPPPVEVDTEPISDPCMVGSASGRWHTEEVCDSWEIVDPVGAVVHFRAVNVRAYSLDANPLDATDLEVLKSRFDSVRLNVNWAQLDPNGSTLDETHLAELQTFLDVARRVGLDVILDVAHLGDIPGGGVFGIPSWAWPAGVEPKPQSSFDAWAGNNAQNLTGYLDRLAGAGLLTHEAIVAVEVVNEPHPREGRRAVGEQAQIELALAYEQLRGHIQSLQAELEADTRLVILGSYYGGVRLGGSWTGEIGTGFERNAIRDLVDNTDTVWTAHSYFAGLGDDDGHGESGQQGEGQSSESWHSAGCYGSLTEIDREQQNTPWSCPTPDARQQARDGLQLDLIGHWSFAQDADRPFFLGEWGMARQRYQTASATSGGEPVGPYRGWGNAHLLICDRLASFADVTGQGHRASWAFWSFDAASDSFGIYLSRDIRSQADNPDTYDLPENAWLDEGTFPAVSGDWAGQRWIYAAPLTTDSDTAETACS